MKIGKIIPLALVLISSSAYALPAAQLLNVSMSGSIPPNCSYNFGTSTPLNSVASPTAPAVVSVTLALNSLKEILGNITVTCNNSGGYTINASSTNSSTLKISGQPSGISYTIGVDAAVPTSISPSATIFTRNAGLGNENQYGRLIKINYPSNPSAVGSSYPSGTYEDTIMLSLQAN